MKTVAQRSQLPGAPQGGESRAGSQRMPCAGLSGPYSPQHRGTASTQMSAAGLA